MRRPIFLFSCCAAFENLVQNSNYRSVFLKDVILYFLKKENILWLHSFRIIKPIHFIHFRTKNNLKNVSENTPFGLKKASHLIFRWFDGLKKNVNLIPIRPVSAEKKQARTQIQYNYSMMTSTADMCLCIDVVNMKSCSTFRENHIHWFIPYKLR